MCQITTRLALVRWFVGRPSSSGQNTQSITKLQKRKTQYKTNDSLESNTLTVAFVFFTVVATIGYRSLTPRVTRVEVCESVRLGLQEAGVGC